MDTLPKVKKYTERTRAKDRTCKNKKGRNGRTQNSDWMTSRREVRVPFGEGVSPKHEARIMSREGLNAIFTQTDVFLPMPMVDDHAHGDHQGHAHKVGYNEANEHEDGTLKSRWERRKRKFRTVMNPRFKVNLHTQAKGGN